MTKETRDLLERIVQEADEYSASNYKAVERWIWRGRRRSRTFEGSVQDAVIDIIYRLTGERIRP